MATTVEQGTKQSEARAVMQRVLAVILTLMLASILAACGAGVPATTDSGASTDGATDGAPARTEASVAFMLEPNSLDPAQYVWRASAISTAQIFEPLVELDHDGNVYPRLAESWEMSDDGTEITFKLREGITFHDGTPFNAEAVKFTFDRILDPETRAQTGLVLIGPYESSEVIDEHTIKMTWSEPFAPIWSNLATTAVMGIVSPAAVAEHGPEFGQNPVGTGPFVFQEWVKGDHITLVPNENYVNTSELYDHDGPPFLETLVHRTIPEDETRLAALLAGELNYALGVPNLDVADLRDNPDVRLSERMFGGAPTMLLINRQLPPTNDLAVAQAIQYAVDKDVINQIATAGNSVVAHGPLKPVMPCYNPAVEDLYPYDPEMAKQVLEEAGWELNADTGIREKDGQVARLVTYSMANPVRISFLEAIQGMLREVGIDLEIEAMSLAASEDLARQGENSLTFMDWEGTDPDILSIHYHSDNIGGWNMGYFDNPDVDALLEQGRAAIDQDERCAIYEELQVRIMEEGATLPLFHQIQIDGISAGLVGIDYDDMNWTPLWYDAQWE